MTARLVVEIGVEELPARWVEAGARTLARRLEQVLADQGMPDIKVTGAGTPRRLVAIGEAIPERQPDREQIVRGPAVKTAYDDGQPTRAAIGFARGQNVDVADLFVEQTAGGEYVHARKVITGRPVVELLADVLPEVIWGVDFPVSMRWGAGEVRYGRPIRWLTVLYGDQVVPVELKEIGIVAGRTSRGHRSVGEVVVKTAAEYEQCLQEAKVITDIDGRRKQIEQLITAAAAEQGAVARIKPDLLDEVNSLVEYPVAVSGQFDAKYLRLPAALLITVMQSHQRYFPLQTSGDVAEPGARSGEEAGLYPGFVCVVGGGFADLEQVVLGHERVLKARLEDAVFFVDSDRERKLEDRVDDLSRIIFIDKVGTVGDRVQRLVELCGRLAEKLGVDEEIVRIAERTAFLAKADLTTHVVGEFPELAGMAGQMYAAASGEKEEVAVAVGEHVLPRFPGDGLPGTMAGVLVGLADRFDALVGFLAAGIRASGSQDPYGLRRQAMAIITLCDRLRLDLSLPAAIAEAIAVYGTLPAGADADQITDECWKLFFGRMRTVLEERGWRHDVIDAVLTGGVGSVPDCFARAEALAMLIGSDLVDDVITVFRRTDHLGREGSGEVNPELFLEDGEHGLWDAIQEIAGDMETGNYERCLQLLAGLRLAVDTFFEHVLVMVDEEHIRQNRLNMLGMVSRWCRKIGDMGKLVIS